MDEKTKILIVDDEPVNLEFFDLMLGKLGFEVLTAHDGEEALDLIRSNTPDLIILDNVMPKMSGWQVTRLLKNDATYSEYKDIPIIMFSAMDNVQDKVEGFELGIEDYITKPFNFSEVLARIRAVLRNHKLHDQMNRKQERVELATSLTENFDKFLEELKSPLKEIEHMAQELQKNGTKDSADFVELVRKEVKKASSSVEELEEKIAGVRQKDASIADHEQSLRDLDKRLKEHFKKLQENQKSMEEVQE